MPWGAVKFLIILATLTIILYDGKNRIRPEGFMGDILRMRIGKTGKAKYISHLELMATMRRALLRSGVRLKYSEGFNPHPYISSALPLSLGTGSLCELLDIGVLGDQKAEGLPERINAALPEGLEIFEAYAPAGKLSGITWVELQGVLHYDAKPPPDIEKALREIYGSESLIITKKTKRGETEIDLAPHIRDVEIGSNGDVTITAKVSANNPTINPDNLLSAINGKNSAYFPDFALFTRIEVYDADMNKFR